MLFERVYLPGMGIGLLNEEPITGSQVEQMRILQSLWVRYINFPCYLGGYVDGGSDSQRDISYLSAVTGPTQQSRQFLPPTNAGYVITLDFKSSPDSQFSRTVVSGIRNEGAAGEIYIITNPGRTDSDGVIQDNSGAGEPDLVVPTLPSSPTQSVRTGNVKILNATFENSRDNQSIQQGESTILLPGYMAREYVEGITFGVDFSEPDATGVLTIDGDQYRLERADEISRRKFAVSLTRNIPER